MAKLVKLKIDENTYVYVEANEDFENEISEQEIEQPQTSLIENNYQNNNISDINLNNILNVTRGNHSDKKEKNEQRIENLLNIVKKMSDKITTSLKEANNVKRIKLETSVSLTTDAFIISTSGNIKLTLEWENND